MEAVLKVLMLEDAPRDAELELRMLERSGMACESRIVQTERDFLEQLEGFEPDLILSDFTLPSFDGLSALNLARERRPDIPYIFVSGTLGEERAIDALRQGATDYVLKSNLARLPSAVARAVRQAEEAKRRLRQDERMLRLSRVRSLQSAIASCLVRIRERQRLLQEACDIAVREGFRAAWMGFTLADADVLAPVACSSQRPEDLEFLRGAGGPASGRALLERITRDRRPHVLPGETGDGASMALGSGGSFIALPLVCGEEISGFWGLHAAERDFFDGEVIRLLSDVVADLSFTLDYIAKQERLNELAYYDVLTGVSNRNLLNEHLKQALPHAARNERLVAVVFVDLDRFKWVNDTFGHGVGDCLLKEVAARIASCTREGDIVARFGGDEFVMVLPDQPSCESVVPVLQRVLDSIAESVRLEGCEVRVSCSIGVAFYPRDGADAETLLHNADAAMYRAKQMGPGKLQFYSELEIA